jgi:uncharacterized membrane protein YkoI
MIVLTMSALALGATLLTAGAAAKSGAGTAEPKSPKIKGTIKVEGSPSLEELKKKIKITQPDAEKAALKAVGAKDGMKVIDSELEIEQGFLIYSIDVKVAGKGGLEEVWVDAGSGKVLARIHDADDDEDDDAGEGAEDDDSD